MTELHQWMLRKASFSFKLLDDVLVSLTDLDKKIKRTLCTSYLYLAVGMNVCMNGYLCFCVSAFLWTGNIFQSESCFFLFDSWYNSSPPYESELDKWKKDGWNNVHIDLVNIALVANSHH